MAEQTPQQVKQQIVQQRQEIAHAQKQAKAFQPRIAQTQRQLRRATPTSQQRVKAVEVQRHQAKVQTIKDIEKAEREFEAQAQPIEQQIKKYEEAQREAERAQAVRDKVMSFYEEGKLWMLSGYGTSEEKRMAREMIEEGYEAHLGGPLQQEEYQTRIKDIIKFGGGEVPLGDDMEGKKSFAQILKENQGKYEEGLKKLSEYKDILRSSKLQPLYAGKGELLGVDEQGEVIRASGGEIRGFKDISDIKQYKEIPIWRLQQEKPEFVQQMVQAGYFTTKEPEEQGAQDQETQEGVPLGWGALAKATYEETAPYISKVGGEVLYPFTLTTKPEVYKSSGLYGATGYLDFEMPSEKRKTIFSGLSDVFGRAGKRIEQVKESPLFKAGELILPPAAEEATKEVFSFIGAGAKDIWGRAKEKVLGEPFISAGAILIPPAAAQAGKEVLGGIETALNYPFLEINKKPISLAFVGRAPLWVAEEGFKIVGKGYERLAKEIFKVPETFTWGGTTFTEVSKGIGEMAGGAAELGTYILAPQKAVVPFLIGTGAAKAVSKDLPAEERIEGALQVGLVGGLVLGSKVLSKIPRAKYFGLTEAEIAKLSKAEPGSKEYASLWSTTFKKLKEKQMPKFKEAFPFVMPSEYFETEKALRDITKARIKFGLFEIPSIKSFTLGEKQAFKTEMTYLADDLVKGGIYKTKKETLKAIEDASIGTQGIKTSLLKEAAIPKPFKLTESGMPIWTGYETKKLPPLKTMPWVGEFEQKALVSGISKKTKFGTYEFQTYFLPKKKTMFLGLRRTPPKSDLSEILLFKKRRISEQQLGSFKKVISDQYNLFERQIVNAKAIKVSKIKTPITFTLEKDIYHFPEGGLYREYVPIFKKVPFKKVSLGPGEISWKLGEMPTPEALAKEYKTGTVFVKQRLQELILPRGKEAESILTGIKRIGYPESPFAEKTIFMGKGAGLRKKYFQLTWGAGTGEVPFKPFEPRKEMFFAFEKIASKFGPKPPKVFPTVLEEPIISKMKPGEFGKALTPTLTLQEQKTLSEIAPTISAPITKITERARAAPKFKVVSPYVGPIITGKIGLGVGIVQTKAIPNILFGGKIQSKEKLKLKTGLLTQETLRSDLTQTEKLQLKQVERLQLKQAEKLQFKQIEKLQLRQVENLQLLQQQRLQLRQQQIMRQAMREPFGPREPPQRRPRVPPPEIPFKFALSGGFGMGLGGRRKKVKPVGYLTEIRRRGKFYTIPSRPLTRQQAIALGMKAAAKEAAATFRLKKISKAPARPFAISRISPYVSVLYRPGKKPGEMVQKRLLRIVSPGEVREISWKGARAVSRTGRIRTPWFGKKFIQNRKRGKKIKQLI